MNKYRKAINALLHNYETFNTKDVKVEYRASILDKFPKGDNFKVLTIDNEIVMYIDSFDKVPMLRFSFNNAIKCKRLINTFANAVCVINKDIAVINNHYLITKDNNEFFSISR